ncbi:MAG: CocE/NonD family hydrolase [Gemmatimonadales bacterium]
MLPLTLLLLQTTISPAVRAEYTQVDTMIPMRDGARLFTTIYAPRDTTRDWPILLTRTPYATDTYLDPLGPGPTYASEGFIFVYQDVRGRYQSEGDFVNVRPHNPRKSGKEIDEASDTYDTIDWLVKNLRHHNGRVAQYGVSYLGFYTTHGILSGHPNLVAASPQAPVTNWFLGDDFNHNGAFLLGDGFAFLSSFGKPRPRPTRERALRFDMGTPDAYDFLLRAGSRARIDTALFKGGIPFWTELRSHRTYDDWWKARDPRPHLVNVKPAVMVVGGWYDHENIWGALKVYEAIERQNPGAKNVLVMGPWYHGQWWFEPGTRLGDQQFGSETSTWYHENVELPFYDCLLKDRCDRPLAEATVYETGANRWRTFDAWPPKGIVETTFALGNDGMLVRDGRGVASGQVEFVSDPAKPVPYIDRIVGARYQREYMVADQRFAAQRPDVLVWETEPLDADLTIAGPIEAKLLVSTTGTDADWVVKLIDVYPDYTPDPSPNPTGVRMGGYQQLVRGEVMRGRFRNSYEKPEAFVPDQPAKVAFTLNDAFHTFRRGHRIMVQVQSSWFPLVERNPQRFIDISAAKPSDYRKATHRVHLGGPNGSAIVLPILPAAPGR